MLLDAARSALRGRLLSGLVAAPLLVSCDSPHAAQARTGSPNHEWRIEGDKDCRRMGGRVYCFPQTMVDGPPDPRPGMPSTVLLSIPSRPERAAECRTYTPTGEPVRVGTLLELAEAYPDDTLKAYARRIIDVELKYTLKPPVRIRWNGLDCLKIDPRSGSPQGGFVCPLNTDRLDHGATLISCNADGEVPSPGCSHEHFADGLRFSMSYKKTCGRYWREIEAETVAFVRKAQKQER